MFQIIQKLVKYTVLLFWGGGGYENSLVHPTYAPRLYLDNGICEDISNDIQQVGGLSALDLERVDDELGDLVQIAGGDL